MYSILYMPTTERQLTDPLPYVTFCSVSDADALKRENHLSPVVFPDPISGARMSQLFQNVTFRLGPVICE